MCGWNTSDVLILGKLKVSNRAEMDFVVFFYFVDVITGYLPPHRDPSDNNIIYTILNQNFIISYIKG